MSFLSFMKRPVGRAIRVVLGLALIVLGLAIGGGLGLAIAAFAMLPITTGVFGVCPVNPLFGSSMRSCALPKQR
jgi:Inner membrane protein YgaP-like, transmembrane domain